MAVQADEMKGFGYDEEEAKDLTEMTTEELIEHTKKARPTMMLVVAGDQEAPSAGFTVQGFDKVSASWSLGKGLERN